MGTDTNLYIGNRWNLEDVKDVIESQFECEVTLNPSEHSPGTFGSIHINNQWFCWYHLDASTPLGNFLMLSRRYSQETIHKFEQIAEIIGGALMREDSNGKIEFINGRLSDSDMLQYHLKYAVIVNRHSGEADSQGLDDLKKSINNWLEKHDKSRQKII